MLCRNWSRFEDRNVVVCTTIAPNLCIILIWTWIHRRVSNNSIANLASILPIFSNVDPIPTQKIVISSPTQPCFCWFSSCCRYQFAWSDLSSATILQYMQRGSGDNVQTLPSSSQFLWRPWTVNRAGVQIPKSPAQDLRESLNVYYPPGSAFHNKTT